MTDSAEPQRILREPASTCGDEPCVKNPGNLQAMIVTATSVQENLCISFMPPSHDAVMIPRANQTPEEHCGTEPAPPLRARIEAQNASHDDHDRERCVVCPNQRRRHHIGSDCSVARSIWARDPARHAAQFPHPPLPDLPGNPRSGPAEAKAREEY